MVEHHVDKVPDIPSRSTSIIPGNCEQASDMPSKPSKSIAALKPAARPAKFQVRRKNIMSETEEIDGTSSFHSAVSTINRRQPDTSQTLNHLATLARSHSNSPVSKSLDLHAKTKLGHRKSVSAFNFDTLQRKASTMFKWRLSLDCDTDDDEFQLDDDKSSTSLGDLNDHELESTIIENNHDDSMVHSMNVTHSKAARIEKFRESVDMDWLKQQSSWISENGLAETIEEFLASLPDDQKSLFLNSEELLVYRQERKRIHDQINSITGEFEKERKMREASLNLFQLYNSSEPISHHHHPLRRSFKPRTHGPKVINPLPAPQSIYSPHEQYRAMMGGDGGPSKGRKEKLTPAAKASSEAFMESAQSLVHLAVTLKELAARERMIDTKIFSHILASLMNGFASESRGRIIHNEQAPAKNKSTIDDDENDVDFRAGEHWQMIFHDRMLRSICEEYVRVKQNR